MNYVPVALPKKTNCCRITLTPEDLCRVATKTDSPGNTTVTGGASYRSIPALLFSDAKVPRGLPV
jgi:hypothetical protein